MAFLLKGNRALRAGVQSCKYACHVGHILRIRLPFCGHIAHSVQHEAASSQAAYSAEASEGEGDQLEEEEASSTSPWSNIGRHLPQEQLEAGLTVVPTPIGNLADITLRALRVLRSSSLVLAEDTRHTRKLLNFYGLKAEMLSYHDHNEKLRVASVIQRLKEGQSVALVSDAGMPGISDPGFYVIAAAVEAGVRVIPLPGACAFVSALVVSGLPTTTFTFYGFLPPKSTARRSRLSELRGATGTLVFYAPPHGLVKVLTDMAEVLGGGRRVCVARELTKMHEELFRSTLQGALEEFRQREPRGEICIVLEGADGALNCPIQGPSGVSQEAGADNDAGVASPASPAYEASPAGNAEGVQQAAARERAWPLLMQLIGSGVPMSAAAKVVAKQLGVSRKELYDVALQVQAEVRSEKMEL